MHPVHATTSEVSMLDQAQKAAPKAGTSTADDTPKQVPRGAST
jgi:hypothetical protein